MTAIEDAREALGEMEAARTIREQALGRARVKAALRALIAEHERLTAPPTDDEREALVHLLFDQVPEDWDENDIGILADAILEGGFRRQGPITKGDYHEGLEEGIKIGRAEAHGPISDALDRACFDVESKHHFHGVQCLCGFESHRSRSRTEHITGEVRAALEAAEHAR